MKPLSELTKSDLANIKAISFDCDGVTVPKGTDISESGNKSTIITKSPSPEFVEKINLLKKHYHIVFNSGRSGLYLIKMFNDLLWENLSLISEIGVFVYHQGQIFQTQALTEYELDTIKKIRKDLYHLAQRDNRVRGFEPKHFLISLHCWRDISEVERIVLKNDTKHQFYCWWNGEAYDINPKRFNKAVGIKYLSDLMEIKPYNFLTIGNGINDLAMTQAAGISVTTDPVHLEADFCIKGEDLGGEVIVDRLVDLL